jgi:hypothetical protein
MLRLAFGLPIPLVPPPPEAASGTASSPPAQTQQPASSTPLRFVGRASLMTMADSISTMTRSQSESQSQPPESQPATTPAVPSLIRCSTGHSTTSATLESDAEDGSDLDENDDAWEDDVVEEQVDEDDDDCENDDNDNGSVHVPLSLAAMLDDLQWKFEEVSKGTNHTPKQTLYEGTSCLRHGVAQSLSTPFECLGICGGLFVAFVKQLAAESND